jgi:hypothetical protein
MRFPLRPAVRLIRPRSAAAIALALLGLTCARPVGAADRWGPWQGRAAIGAELSTRSFGIVDLGLRKGPFSLELLTDTLDLRYAPALRRGRAWVGLRVEAFAAGLMLAPWSQGAPDPGRAWNAGYGGLDGGWVRYLPASFYAGVQGSARLYLFWATEGTVVAPPGPTPLFTAETQVGHYTPHSHLWLRAGVDASLQTVAPHLVAEASLRPDWAIAPRLEVRAAWASGQDFLMRTRLGGLNPYVVPLAGAAWAEFWVESYIALRGGPSLRAPLPGRGPHTLELSLVSDFAGFDGRTELGFAALASWRYRRLFVNASFGCAPWLTRQPGIGRTAGFVLFGADWDGFWKL